jgi:enoyl-CoA hydratase/carnithine racemase
MSTYETLIVERRGHVGWLIFNRPEALNAHNLQMLVEVPQAWEELADDDDVRVIVNTGRGRGFSTGADVREIAAAGGMGARMAKLDEGNPAPRRGLGARANDVWKPVITAVNGVCAGGGLHFVAEADIVLASSNATFVDTHVSVGQVAALEPIGLYGRMPFSAILRMALIGRHERLNAERAHQLGMVDEVVDPPEALEAVAQALAEKIALNSPSALMATKRAIWEATEVGRAAALAEGMEYVKGFWGHPDNSEGARAFSEKRDPDWAPPSRTF